MSPGAPAQPATGLYHAPLAQHPKRGSVTRAASLKSCAKLADALKKLADDYDFPDYFGANLDATYDCLTDPDWLGTSPTRLQIDGLSVLSRKDPEGVTALIEVLASVAEDWRANGHTGWILIDQASPGVPSWPAP